MWPHDWIIITIGNHQIHAAPHEYLHGLMLTVAQWQDHEARNRALQVLAQLLQDQALDPAEYSVRTRALAAATVYASLGLASSDACTWCIDTLEELVP